MARIEIIGYLTSIFPHPLFSKVEDAVDKIISYFDQFRIYHREFIMMFESGVAKKNEKVIVDC